MYKYVVVYPTSFLTTDEHVNVAGDDDQGKEPVEHEAQLSPVSQVCRREEVDVVSPGGKFSKDCTSWHKTLLFLTSKHFNFTTCSSLKVSVMFVTYESHQESIGILCILFCKQFLSTFCVRPLPTEANQV